MFRTFNFRRVAPMFAAALVIGTLNACANSGINDLGSRSLRDGKVVDYTGVLYAPENTDTQLRIEGRTYEQVGVDANGEPIWKQVGDTTTTVTAGEHEGSKWGRAALGAGSVIGGAAILRGADAPSAAATAKQGQSTAAGTGANAGNVDID